MNRDDYIGVSTIEEEEAFQRLEEKQAQEEAHKHFVIHEFSTLLLADGPTAVINQMPKEAQDELRQAIINQYVNKLSNNQGL